MHRPGWSSLEYVLAVAQHGSIAAAARALNVSHTTVMRRVRAFEEKLAEPVFEHHATGYRLTETGQFYVEAAEKIESTLADLDLKVAGADDTISGEVRITTTDSIFPVLAEDIVELQRLYPDLDLQARITNQRLDLFNRDADIAVRPSSAPPEDLIGRRATELGFGVYANRQQATLASVITDYSDLPWLGFSPPMNISLPAQWMDEHVDPSAIVIRGDSFVSLMHLAKSGAGFTILPCLLGDQQPDIVRVFSDTVRFSVDLWVLTHRDMLRSQRVRACSNFIYEAIRARRQHFEGT